MSKITAWCSMDHMYDPGLPSTSSLSDFELCWLVPSSSATTMLSLALVALLAIANANPMPAVTPSPVLYPAVTKLVTALKQRVPASAFCSSYLRIPIVTAISTQTETRSDGIRVATMPPLTKAPAWLRSQQCFQAL